MRTLVTIFLLVLLTAAQTPLGQLLKFPVLIEHFYQHNKQEGASLLAFLNDHYAGEHNDADQREDERLPFKTVLLQGMGSAIVPGVPTANITFDYVSTTKVVVRNSYTPQQHLCRIFHPPRV
jgi:hypothetical protein